MRGVLAACLIVATGCQDNDPLYCGKHPADLDNCPRAGCYGMAALGLLACATVTPPGPIAIGVNTVIDTTAGVSSPAGLTCAPLDADSSAVCLLEGTTIAIAAGATLYGTGARPLVLATSGSIDIAGTLDVASHVGIA